MALGHGRGRRQLRRGRANLLLRARAAPARIAARLILLNGPGHRVRLAGRRRPCMPPSTASAIPGWAGQRAGQVAIAAATSSAPTSWPVGWRACRAASSAAPGPRPGLEQPPDPRGVGGAGVHAVDPDPLADVVGGHGGGKGQHGALGRAVEGPPWQAGGGHDRAGVDDRGRRSVAGGGARRGWPGRCPTRLTSRHGATPRRGCPPPCRTRRRRRC